MWSRVARSAVVTGVLLVAGLPALAAGESGEKLRFATLDASERSFRVAVAAHRRGDLELASRHYEEAIARDAEFVEAMVNAARVLLAAGENQRALEWLDRAERARSDYPHIGAVRGVLALQQGDTPLAMDSLGEAIAMLPGDEAVRINLGAALIEGGRPERAIRVLRGAIEGNADSPEAVFNLGLAHDYAGRHEEAVFFYRQFLAVAALGDADRPGIESRIEELTGERSSKAFQFGDVIAKTSGPAGRQHQEEEEHE